MQAWEDNQLAAQESLQQLFLRSDANGDGILQLDEFSAMLKTHRPEISEGEAFRLYDETMALSERMLGYETDAILADAFVRTAVSHQLFPNLGSAFRSHETPLPNPYLERGRAARSPSPPHAGGALPAAAGQSAKGGGADSRLAARARHDSPMRIALASARAGGGPGSPGAGPRSPSPGSPSAPAAGAAASGALRRPSGLSGVQVVSIAGAVPQSLSDHGVQQVPSPAASRSYVLSAPRHEVAPLPRLHEARWPSTERRAEARAKA